MPKGECSKEGCKKTGGNQKLARRPPAVAGGSLSEDLQNLAVPFAILLAKQGIETMFIDRKKQNAETVSAKSAIKSTGTKKTATKKTKKASPQSGGSCGCTAAITPMAGGAKKGAKKTGGSLSSLSAAVDHFIRSQQPL